jgi:hypothetical protein
MHAQDSSVVQNSLSSGSLASQFDYIYQVSNNFQEYEVVKKANLEKLKSNVSDSIRVLRKEISELKQLQSAVTDTIAFYSQSLEKANLERDEALLEKDSFTIFGFLIQKNLFVALMWSLVAALGAGLGFYSVQFFRSFGRIKKAQIDLDELQLEFEQHRKTSLERERKLKRELIDAQMKKN